MCVVPAISYGEAIVFSSDEKHHLRKSSCCCVALFWFLLSLDNKCWLLNNIPALLPSDSSPICGRGWLGRGLSLPFPKIQPWIFFMDEFLMVSAVICFVFSFQGQCI